MIRKISTFATQSGEHTGLAKFARGMRQTAAQAAAEYKEKCQQTFDRMVASFSAEADEEEEEETDSDLDSFGRELENQLDIETAPAPSARKMQRAQVLIWSTYFVHSLK